MSRKLKYVTETKMKENHHLQFLYHDYIILLPRYFVFLESFFFRSFFKCPAKLERDGTVRRSFCSTIISTDMQN